MLNTKYLNNNNKIKKKVINLFIPMLFGLKMNKTLYNDNMYYKLFYLLFNHISLIEVFLKDKKIFYNFSKYFQINLYIYLIKTNLIILDLFFHFFYMLFLTFENFEDIYTNTLFLKGYKQRAKRKTFFKRWIKPDYGIQFYFNQRINSISLYVLNYNIYKNIYFSKYNIFIIHTKLIYKLFHYFKMLQYKLQSFVILYKKHFKIEKKIRLLFAKSNCMIYKYLNLKLIKYFSFYKLYLKKKKISNENNLINTKLKTSTFKNIDLIKKIINKPIYNKVLKNQILKEKSDKTLNDLNIFTDIFLAKRVFKFIFGSNLISLYSNLFYHTVIKLKWLKDRFLNNKIYYKTIFVNFLKKFSITYLLSIQRNTVVQFNYKNNKKVLHVNLVHDNFEEINKKILGKFLLELKIAFNFFISNFFHLNNLVENIKNNFINFVMEKMKFNFFLRAISHISQVKFKTISELYSNIIKLIEHFFKKDFNIKHVYFYLTDNQRAKNKIYLATKNGLSTDYDDTPTYDFPCNHIKWRWFQDICYSRLYKYEHFLVRNKFSRFNFSILDLPKLNFDIQGYEGEEYKNFKYEFDYIMDELNFYNRSLLSFKQRKKLPLIFLKVLKKAIGKINYKEIKKKILNLLSKKVKKKKKKNII